MILNPCQNLVWAPLEENPPIIPSLLGSFSTEVFESQPEARSRELVSSALFYFNVLFSATVSVWMSVGAIFNQVSEKYWLYSALWLAKPLNQSNSNLKATVTRSLTPLSSLHLYLFEFSLACSDIFQLYDWLSWLLFIRQSIEMRSNSTSYYQVNYTPSLVVPGQVKSIINQSTPIHSSQNLK